MIQEKIIIVGGRTKARTLAQSLIGQGHSVTVVNAVAEDCRQLAAVDGLNVIHGDGTKPYILDEAGAGEADVIIAMSPRDEDNLIACQLGKKMFKVARTVALVGSPDKVVFFRRLGIDHPVCAVQAVTKIIEQQAFLEEMKSMVSFEDGRVNIVELVMDEDCPAVRQKLRDIVLPEGVIIGALLRGSITIIPRGETRLLPGDKLIILSAGGREVEAVRILRGVRAYE